ncbi:polysaccharide pyruvyl transferase family protein [Dendronalium sp. ChiSLP03b]|uniref:polysaccharide pyruvyl transferase family protein n=1 Tax=Dendronalium sp. ChiSLP03b TaxID=3075381 RepID=UPI002AD58F18|nr:polysaccharide pyruvyl transferase family protein [Dendronalium sp. ChiSLP03b]MDZ8202857.1 polysaccharide pyruvyl transferase family protein [Dendronalium sp. ChiSLP03b]
MKIGILTFHHTTNYGATLQTYALWTTIKSLGHDVEIIDYRPYVAVQYYQRDIQKLLNRKRQFIKIKVLVALVKLIIKRLKIKIFLNTKIKLSKDKFYTRDSLNAFDFDYDIVISGSDQVWCLDSYRGFDPSFFLDFIESKKIRKISYAASFSFTENLGQNKELIGKLISDFESISVRDNHSLRIIERECNSSAIRVLDPTFLINFNEIKVEPKLREDYLLIYCEGEMEDYQEDFIKSIAEKKELLIISVGRFQRVAHNSFIDIGLEEWIGYFSKASFVVTDTYHGTIFSIKFKKLFTVFANQRKSNKTNCLLEKLELKNRMISKEEYNNFFVQFLSIDYTSVDEKLRQEISKSKNYLSEAIQGKSTRNYFSAAK